MRDEFHLAATAQNLRKLAKLIPADALAKALSAAQKVIEHDPSIHKLGFGSHLAGTPQQCGEEQGAPLSNRHQLPVPEKCSVVGIKQKRTKGDSLRGHTAFIAASELLGIISAPLRDPNSPRNSISAATRSKKDDPAEEKRDGYPNFSPAI